MATSTSTLVRILDAEMHSPVKDLEASPLSTPSKVAFSSAQNPLRSITPGYRETDIQLLTMEATRPTFQQIPSSESEREVSTYPDVAEQKREIYRQIAVSFSSFTLYLIAICAIF
jgi:hypothetical protein